MPFCHLFVRPRAAAALMALALLAGCAVVPAQAPAIATVPALPAVPPVPPVPPVPEVATDAPLEQRFAQWLDHFRAHARSQGITEATLHAGLDGVTYQARSVALDRAQPEFTRSVWAYLDSAVSPQRVARGQQQWQAYRAEADAASARYGVPVPILMAVWGIESNYGSHYGDVPVIDALATLGFDGRRESWARGELLAALKILQRGDIARDRMVGSWAGAMGQTQFMPSVFLAHAVDADGDGRRDLWGSMADVLASTAHFIARSGWRPAEVWGTEVQLPAGFDLRLADPTVRHSAAQWAQAGVQAVDGNPLPALADASILLPAGVRGPAFLVGHNYRVILRYNNATSYALAVALLAQRIAGGPAVQTPWPRELRALTRSEILALQTALNQRGFDSGKPDGQFGPATRKALRQWQHSQGLPADGFATDEVLRRVVGE